MYKLPDLNTLHLENLSPFEQYIFARFAYRNGIPYITDAEYDKLHIMMQRLYPQDVYVNTSYDDDPIPYDLLRAIGYSDDDCVYFGSLARLDAASDDCLLLMERLNESVSKSIQPLRTYQEVYNALEGRANLELSVSLKVDGFKCRNLYLPVPNVPGVMRHALTLTRGRHSGQAIDVTHNLSRIVPRTIVHKSFVGLEHLVVNGECFYYESGIPIVNQKYGIDLRVPRSAGISFARSTEYQDEDYMFFQFLAFNLEVGATLSEGLQIASDIGFEVVPHHNWVYTPKTFNQFKEEIDEIIRDMHNLAEEQEIPCDGLVFEINSRDEYSRQATEAMYDNGNFAAKIGAWAPGVYVAKVVDIYMVQRADRMNCKLIIKPTITQSGVVVTNLDLHNPNIMIENDLDVGDEILFEYRNETTPVFLRLYRKGGQDVEPGQEHVEADGDDQWDSDLCD